MPRRKFRPKFPWAKLSDEELLEVRLKDLKVTVEGTWLERCLHTLYDELAEHGIRVRPHAWISSEWFSPENTPGIAMPFFLAHPRLMRLEKKMILDVEGGTWSECMGILRHEAGHVVTHAYQLYRRRRWQQLFGPSSQRYPRYYRPNPASRNHVQHLRLWYAQSHPDEDFAETFAVWLRPRSHWRSRYAGWPALKKLEYVDELMAEIAGKRPTLTHREKVDPLSKLNQTLGDYYKKKRALYVVDTPKTYDRDLRRLFSADPKHRRSEAASSFIRRNRADGARTGGEVDRRISAHFRCRARRYDPALPRTQFARGRLRAQTDHGIHGAVDRQDHACIVWSVAAKMDRAMKRLRVLVLVHPDLIPPESSKGYSEQEINVWKTEYDVVTTLRAAGHEVRPLGVHDELKPIRDEIEAWKPDVVFTLLEQFRGEAIYDQNVVSYLELLHVPYTGCNPRGLMLARGKDLSKTLVHYHRIPVPAFAVFPMRRKVKRPARLALPLIVKSVNEDASYGISQASVVDTDDKLVERVNFIHERIGTAAIAEQYIEGREIYVGVVGNDRLLVLPVWELQFSNMAEGDWHIATEKVKHDPDYQERRGILHGPAKDLTPELAARIQNMAKRIYRTLELDGYARIDFRLAADGTPYFLEANPNPEIAESQEFATAARHVGISYPDLLQRIVALGIRRAGPSAGGGLKTLASIASFITRFYVFHARRAACARPRVWRRGDRGRCVRASCRSCSRS